MTGDLLLRLWLGGTALASLALCAAHLAAWACDLAAAREADRVEALVADARAILDAPTCDNRGGP